MPRPRKPGVEPKRRSRNGCWPCKTRKVKCGEEKPHCSNCVRQNEPCDYSIRLNWGGRLKRNPESAGNVSGSDGASDSPFMSVFGFEDTAPLNTPPHGASMPPNIAFQHARLHSNSSLPRSKSPVVDPDLDRLSRPEAQPIGSAGPFDQNQHLQDIRTPPTSAPFGYIQPSVSFDFGSPPNGYESFDYTNIGFTSNRAEMPHSSPSMPPPRLAGDMPFKRHKSSHSTGSPATTISDAYSPNTGPPTPYSPFIPPPLTPNSSLGTDEASIKTASKQDGTAHLPSDLRRLSVQSLINEPQAYHGSPDVERGRQYPIADSTFTIYGYDLGLPDYDSPRNNDHAAIAVFSPPSGNMQLEGDSPFGSTEPRCKDIVFEKGGYYAEPVPIRIPRSLEPLPPLLQENPMNLLYFHHFINCTARILVPHDCERNPFRHILPEMAVGDESIMQLLLAYSAYHRARMLNQPEPANRIAIWVQDLFPKLRESLTENPNSISNNTLAAVIMMASLEIISSNTFEVPVSWQSHLQMARQMILTRGGPCGMDRQDRVAYFLSRWFAYLDVVGSLSGNKNDTPLGSFYWSSENASADEDFEIDCLLGFTTRCIGSLARLSELAKQCEPQRIDEQGNIRAEWRPDLDVVHQAASIRRDLEEGLSAPKIHKGCNHRSSDSSESEEAWDTTEIYATNEMFHWAGLIHLYRRVLGKPAMDDEVQHAVREIVDLLYKVRRGSPAEVCLLFPMFAAGCDAQDEGQREKIMDRLVAVEGAGMNQVNRARSLMRRVWDTGKAWESLVSGEFFG